MKASPATTNNDPNPNGMLSRVAVITVSLLLMWMAATYQTNNLNKSISIGVRNAVKAHLNRNDTAFSSFSPHLVSLGAPQGDDTRPFLVVCTRLRNEAPYIREWMEHHLALGFDHFLLMNDESTDDTQCFLDIYTRMRRRGRPLVRLLDSQLEQGRVFDECAKILHRENRHFNTSNTWIMTHDLDEFLMFNSSRYGTLKHAVAHLSQFMHNGSVKSLQIPRLAFGSSGQDQHLPGLLMERFTQRFDPSGCSSLGSKTEKPYCNKFALCHKKAHSTTALDGVKSMSLVSALATQCYSKPRSNKKWIPDANNRCMTTHLHEISDPELHGAPQERLVAKSKRAEYLKKEELEGSLVLAHYMIKSRQEFYQRICTSQFYDKYYEPEGCTPAMNFDVMLRDFNVWNDTRMLRYVERVHKRLSETENLFAHCNADNDVLIPYNLSMEQYFQDNCWDPQEFQLQIDMV